MDVHFCDQCHNLTKLYIQGSDKNLVHYCSSCNTSEICDSSETRVYTMNYKGIDKSLSLNQNKYITHDITLPKLVDNPNITCPNEECPSHAGSSSVTYIKYDTQGLRFLYICDHCGQKWKNI